MAKFKNVLDIFLASYLVFASLLIAAMVVLPFCGLPNEYVFATTIVTGFLCGIVFVLRVVNEDLA